MSLKFLVSRPTLSISLALMLSTGSATGAQQEHNHHAHHQQMMAKPGYQSSLQSYAIPELSLIDIHNNKVSLSKALGEGGPIILNFIFTTCTTICPVLSATFSQVQGKLGDKEKNVRMISITIDPEQDTPERLKEYASKFKAGANWQFLTGSPSDIITTQKAFDAYRGDKMNHIPLTLLRTKTDGQWLRLEGFASAAEIVAEYRQHLVESTEIGALYK
ncbi:MAG: SCO family protein [Gammaproteobacteria bacterium]|nr:SCO family protein [Gammaproteobacteria bacterium]